MNKIYIKKYIRKTIIEMKSSKEDRIQISKMKMESIWKNEGLEAINLEDAVEMYAFDLGYQNIILKDWFIELGEHLGIDVQSSHRLGVEANYANLVGNS